MLTYRSGGCFGGLLEVFWQYPGSIFDIFEADFVEPKAKTKISDFVRDGMNGVREYAQSISDHVGSMVAVLFTSSRRTTSGKLILSCWMLSKSRFSAIQKIQTQNQKSEIWNQNQNLRVWWSEAKSKSESEGLRGPGMYWRVIFRVLEAQGVPVSGL